MAPVSRMGGYLPEQMVSVHVDVSLDSGFAIKYSQITIWGIVSPAHEDDLTHSFPCA